MSKFTKFLVPFLLIALLFAQMLPMHAASAETLPEINPNLCGLINGQDNLSIYNLNKKAKSYLEYRGNPDLAFDNVVCMLNRDNVLTNYYVGEDNRVYLEDAQDHRFVEPAYTVENRIWDLAAAPLVGQVDNGCVIAIPADNTDDLLLTSFISGVDYDRVTVSFTEQEELAAIAAKYIENYSAEYYLLGRSGAVWSIALEIDDHCDRMTITSIEKVLETGVTASGFMGFFFDGEMIYRTYYTAQGSALMAINPETKTVYNYGVVEAGVVIRGLYDACKMAPNCNDVPEPIDTLDTTISGLFQQDGQGDNRLVAIKTKNMKNYKQHLEFRGDPDLVLANVICQLNAANEIETYYIGDDRYIYVEDEQDHRFLDQSLVRLDDRHIDYAPGPINYQESNGWVVGIYENGLALTLTSFLTGEDEKCIDLVGLLGWHNNAVPMSVVAIAAKSLIGSVAEYYLLDMDGIIWSATISFPEFELIDLKEIADTCVYAHEGEGFYFDGTWLFRTYWDNNKNGSVITVYHPETDTFYDLGVVEQGMYVYSLYEAGRIPTVESDEHAWKFEQFVWDTEFGYKATAVYSCVFCGEETRVEATVNQLSHEIVSEFEATIRADEAPDGEDRTEIKRVLPAFGGFEWDTTNGVKAYAIYVCKVPGCYDHQYRVQATVTKVNPNTVIPKYKAVVTAEQAPDGVERTETKTVINKSNSNKWKKVVVPINPEPKPIYPIHP